MCKSKLLWTISSMINLIQIFQLDLLAEVRQELPALVSFNSIWDEEEWYYECN